MGAGNWSERLLKSLYYITWRRGDQLPLETEALWRTAAANKRNIIPVLDSDTLSAYFGVAKRIALYLARPSPHATIDHLAYEISLLMTEDSLHVPETAASSRLLVRRTRQAMSVSDSA